MAMDASGEHVRPVVEVEFCIWDSTYPFVAATGNGDCTMELAEMVPRANGKYAEFFTVTGASPDRILAFAATHRGVEASLLRAYDDGGLFEFVTSENCPAVALAEFGALPRAVTSADGEGRIVAEIPHHYDPAAVTEAFLDENPDASLVSKREKDSFTTVFGEPETEEVLHAHLTDRQREVLERAFEAGYYEWPRECTGAEVADDLGISSATFSEHIHAAERKLLTALLDGTE